MIRSILPVGQGAFYLERFTDIATIIYDCGSTSKKTIEQTLDQYLEKDETISALFISHLHDDHINGLPYLLQHCDVERIYLPYLTESQKAIELCTVMFKYGTVNSFTKQMIENSYRCIRNVVNEEHRNMPQIIYVYPPNREYVNDDVPERRHIYSGTEIQLSTFSNRELNEIESDWVFVPYNFCYEELCKDFLSILNNRFHFQKPISPCSIAQKLKDKVIVKSLKNCYKKLFDDFNMCSMTLYSGPKSTVRSHLAQFLIPYFRSPFPDIFTPLIVPAGCLYSGDHNIHAKEHWEQLQNCYKSYRHCIGLFQIPHHGSKYSFNDYLLHENFVFFISAGYGNHFQHPHATVLKSLIESKCLFFWVNEHVGSQLHLKIIII